jgi:hypothetical protein
MNRPAPSLYRRGATVADRVAQEVARRYLEPILEPVFHTDSYGYRPGKSAIDAVGKARERAGVFAVNGHELVLVARRRLQVDQIADGIAATGALA